MPTPNADSLFYDIASIALIGLYDNVVNKVS